MIGVVMSFQIVVIMILGAYLVKCAVTEGMVAAVKKLEEHAHRKAMGLPD